MSPTRVGAVIVDEKISKWNPNVVLEANGPMSAFIVIDKKSGDLNEVIKRVVVDLKLPPGEDYGLIFEEPKAFLTATNLSRVSHGFMLTRHYVQRIHAALSNRDDFANIEWALGSLESFASDGCFASCFYSLSNIQLLYDLLADEKIESFEIRSLVLSEVPPQSLIRHLEKSDERVALAALSLMNALHEKSDADSREQIVNYLLIEAYCKDIGVPVAESDVELLLNKEVISSSAIDEMQLMEWTQLLLANSLGKFAVDVFSKYTDQHLEDLRINSMGTNIM
ncbi:unnamed protein product [Nippostrongylus brasiliensis]|uniref:Cell death abnormality protein 12 (inferred by orthology to a C. elegans protein) n=1 Tax=Nippostrongylus brasiliensis TaxID=27835 RepID=A0A0N4YRK9_NIPBR|nr:unnamed protein product [Nippostrongylus brasiliensis]